MRKRFISILLIFSFFAILAWYVLRHTHVIQLYKEKFSSEQKLQSPTTKQIKATRFDFKFEIKKVLHNFPDNFKGGLALLILQVIIIVTFARFLGYLFSLISQPNVIGEIIAGIILGPSLLGLIFPGAYHFLFPANSLNYLKILSQLGLILFMFIVGMELDIATLKTKVRKSIYISQAGIIFPYLLGMILAYFLYDKFAPPSTSLLSFALFMGISMSITAFPVLARIIHERGLTKKPLGIIAITSAAADDIVAWCLLAVVIAIAKAGNISSAILTIILSAVYIAIMFYIIQPILKRIGNIFVSKENLNKSVVAFVFILLLLSAFLTEAIGIHALFGAFIAGVIMPQNTHFKKVFIEKIEDISMVVFLPLFFALSGLRTQIGLLDTWNLWFICILVIFTALLGKFGGVTLASRAVGFSWQNSLSLGTLMNTRGLMELIVLGIGYELGVLSPEIFTMFVIMALATTFAAGPALDIFNYFFKKKGLFTRIIERQGHSKILISFAQPKMGSSLLKLAWLFADKNNHNSNITALHITPTLELRFGDSEYYEKESFQYIQKTAKELGTQIKTIYRASGKVNREIRKILVHNQYDLVLAGSAKTLFGKDITGGKVRILLNRTELNVGILIDNKLSEIKKILLLYYDEKDNFLLDYGNKVLDNEDTSVSLFRYSSESSNLPENYNNRIVILEDAKTDKSSLSKFDLLILSLDCWNKLTDLKPVWLEYSPSILILKPKDNL